MASDIVIRDARPEDNESLIELDRQCVMGGAIQLVFDRSPDFFARSRAYASYRLCVAEEAGQLIGVGGMALKQLRVGGGLQPWAYFYDLRVRPDQRRRGVAARIADVLGDAARAAGVAGGYSLVLEGNVPSEVFVAGRGNVPFRQCAMALCRSGVPGADAGGFDGMGVAGTEIGALLDATYGAYEFAPVWNAQMLAGIPDRLAALGWQGMYGKRVRGNLEVCFGLWDYSAVMRMQVAGRGTASPIRPFLLYPLGWRSPERLGEGLRAAAAMAGARGGTLLLAYDGTDPVAALVPREALTIGIRMFVRAIEGDAMGRGCVFVDPADL